MCKCVGFYGGKGVVRFWRWGVEGYLLELFSYEKYRVFRIRVSVA